MADFGTKDCALGSASWDQKKRTGFVKRLAGIVNRPECYIVSASVEVRPYRSFIKQSPHAHVNGPVFSGCAQACLQVAEIILAREGRHIDKVAYAFEKGDREHELHKMVREWEEINNSERSGLRSLSFLPKSTTGPRWSLQNRPMRVTSKPANGLSLRTDLVVPCLRLFWQADSLSLRDQLGYRFGSH